MIADGYVAVEAMDGQQVKNLGRDILALAKNLGISKGILDRGESIKQFADDNDWSALKEELEAMQGEVKQEMDSLHDEGLVTLLERRGLDSRHLRGDRRGAQKLQSKHVVHPASACAGRLSAKHRLDKLPSTFKRRSRS